MRMLIFATYCLIAFGSQAALGAKMPITIEGVTDEGHPCSIRAVVKNDHSVEQLVVSSAHREIYSGNFMTVEKHEGAAGEPVHYTQSELDSFQFIPEMRNGERKGALMRADIRVAATEGRQLSTESANEVKRVRIKIYEGKTKGFSFSQRSSGTKFNDETYLACYIKQDQ